MTTQSDPLRRCIVPLGGVADLSGGSLSPFATGDVSSALNAPVMSRRAPQDNARSTPRSSDEMLRLISRAPKVALFEMSVKVKVTVIPQKMFF